MLVQLVSVCTLSQRHLERVIFTVPVHTSALQPRDLGLAAHSPSVRVPWPFLRDFPTPCTQKSDKIPHGVGGQTQRGCQTEPKLYVLGSSVFPGTLSYAGSAAF